MGTVSMAETRNRACPYCRSRFVVSLGHVEASVIGIQSDYRCPTCAKDFVLLFGKRLMIKAELGAPGGL
jgi:DNA-directed RNA polymerase subunit RPC12/RpoP